MEKMKNDKKNLKIVVLLFCFLVLFWVLFSFRSKAAADQDYFPIEQNKNGHFTDNSISAIANYFNDEENYIVVYYFDYNYRAIVFPKSDYTNNLGQLCGEKYNNLYQFSLYQLGTLHINTYQFQLMNGTQIINLINFGSNSWGYWQGLYSSNYNANIDYVSNLRVWTTNNSSKKLVINYEEDPIWADPDNDTYPQNADEPNIDNYIPDNEPSFDNTDTMSGLQSIFNFLTWLGDLIKGLFNYVVNALNWGLQKVINSVRNAINGLLTGIQTAISNAVTTITGALEDIKDFAEDISEKLTDFADLFIHPFDEEEYEEQIANCQLISQYDELMDNCEDIRAIFNNAVERDYFVLYIDFENPFADSEHKIIHSEISFTWLKDYRSIYRPFLWVFTMMECFIGGMRLLGGIIGGKAK